MGQYNSRHVIKHVTLKFEVKDLKYLKKFCFE